MNNLALLTGADTKASKVYSDDVFSSWVYPEYGSTQTITNKLDLAGKGGMVWTKERSTASYDHIVCTTALGVGSHVRPNRADLGKLTSSMITSFNSDGYTLSNLSDVYHPTLKYVAWSFLNARNFYHHTVVTKTAGSNATFTFSTIATLGMVRVKRTDAAGSWYIWHRSLSAGQLLIGETTAAAATLGHITVSGNTVTLVNGVIADGTYLVEAFAHDTGVDGIIQCGSVTYVDAASVYSSIGWEPQWMLVKRVDAGAENWGIIDSMRGLAVKSVSDNSIRLYSNNSDMEGLGTYGNVDSTGWLSPNGRSATQKFIYLAIRRQNKPPTLGTQVYNAIARTGTGAAATVTGVGFAPDLVIVNDRTKAGYTTSANFEDRLRGSNLFLESASTSLERTAANSVSFDVMDGVKIGSDTGLWGFNVTPYTYINWFFKRAPGVLDQICYTGTGTNKTEFHNLTVAPELWLIKSRSAATQWVWGSTLLSNTEKINMPTVTGRITDTTSWNSTSPTSTTISLGTSTDVNASAATYVAYLWASKAGIQKITSFVGDGTTGRILDCGFTTGARFVCIKATSTTGNWWIWDSTRGIISAADPVLAFNSTAAEITSADAVDPHVSGIILNQEATCSINALDVSYLLWAIA